MAHWRMPRGYIPAIPSVTQFTRPEAESMLAVRASDRPRNAYSCYKRTLGLRLHRPLDMPTTEPYPSLQKSERSNR